MINIFRNIRKQLASENKLGKYLRYAIGEVLLIMLGIFMALQLQNWNEKRKQEQQFNTILEQIYDALHYDSQHFVSEYEMYLEHVDDINLMLNHPDSVPSSMIPFHFFSVNYAPINEYTSDVSFHVENLSFSKDNQAQNELFKQITNYVKEINHKIPFDHTDVDDLLEDMNLPWPEWRDDKNYLGLNFTDSTYYTGANLVKIENFRNSPSYIHILKKIKFANVAYQGVIYRRYKYAESLMQQIKTFYPEAKLIFNNVGIIGTSLDGFDDVGAISTPMTLTDGENTIWETTLYLKQGEVKFRSNDSWFQNWGADTFPKGTGSQDGPNIPIPEAGNYHIVFKPVTGEYEFIKQD